MCLLLEPFVRVLIDGSTPLYLVEAPTPATGKSLLVDAFTSPALGRRRAAKMAEARDPDEWRKRLTAKLRTAPAYLVIDNVKRPLDSGALAMTITAGEVEDRLLGVSEAITLPVRCTLAATANNPTLSDEMARRMARTRLDAGVEFPERRKGFRHPDLLGWATANRALLIWSALTLARAWVSRGGRLERCRLARGVRGVVDSDGRHPRHRRDRRLGSTFSCDIAYSDSPAASRASLGSR